MADIKFYLDALQSDKCLCGRTKKPNNSFCYRCYKELPGEMQRNLYRRMGDGYESAVNDAAGYLQTEIW